MNGRLIPVPVQILVPLGPVEALPRRGPPGPPGQSATIEIGEVTDGEEPSVTNVGTARDAVFDIVLPKSTVTIHIGDVTTGAPGSDATVENVGSDTFPVLDITIPRGDVGAAATIEIGTVTLLDPDEPPTVVNVGTPQAAVLNFGIPQGTTGAPAPVAVFTGDYSGVAPTFIPEGEAAIACDRITKDIWMWDGTVWF